LSSGNDCKLNGGKAYALASFGGGAARAFGGAVSLWFSFFNNKTNQIIGYQSVTYSRAKILMNTVFRIHLHKLTNYCISTTLYFKTD
jgi:hypothetical protein